MDLTANIIITTITTNITKDSFARLKKKNARRYRNELYQELP